MPKAYLSLGSNIGDRRAYLRAAIKILKNHKDVEIRNISGIYEAEPEGYVSQRKFYNIAIEVETILSPMELLRACQFVEEFLKRKRKIKWGPRTIDIDILLYGSQEIKGKELVIPHPLMCQRAFMLMPLLEIAPDAKFPSGLPVSSCLDSLSAPFNAIRIGNLE
ncbi:MAG: 2-amino-4-hydroxy-6-hydroxymethyldihydropteridine diphosphokinase [Actinomycetota bacterium]|nr:2-amino-4-hydroxy-6-hydroxymethyldihydropteridine diphosphokinase [Actinomycetota bacterium]